MHVLVNELKLIKYVFPTFDNCQMLITRISLFFIVIFKYNNSLFSLNIYILGWIWISIGCKTSWNTKSRSWATTEGTATEGGWFARFVTVGYSVKMKRAGFPKATHHGNLRKSWNLTWSNFRPVNSGIQNLFLKKTWEVVEDNNWRFNANSWKFRWNTHYNSLLS